MFDRTVRAALGPITQDSGGLAPSEAAAVLGAAPRRVAEFASGRGYARAALRSLALPGGPVGRHPDGAPAWPDQVVGSISHASDLCCAVVAKAGDIQALGVDLERARDISPLAARRVCSDEEVAAHPRILASERWSLVQIAFCAKEAGFKALASSGADTWNLRQLEIRFGPEMNPVGAFQLLAPHASRKTQALARRVVGRWRFLEGWVIAGATVYAERSAQTAQAPEAGPLTGRRITGYRGRCAEWPSPAS